MPPTRPVDLARATEPHCQVAQEVTAYGLTPLRGPPSASETAPFSVGSSAGIAGVTLQVPGERKRFYSGDEVPPGTYDRLLVLADEAVPIRTGTADLAAGDAPQWTCDAEARTCR